MKNVFFISLMFFICSLAYAAEKIKINIAVLRNSNITHGTTCILADNRTNIVYQDEKTYVEADVVESTSEYIVMRFLISSANAHGMYVARGMPRMKIPMSNGMGMASLNCEGSDEHFTLIVSACY